MQRESLMLRLKEIGLADQNSYQEEAFSRNIGILTAEEQERLSQARAAIAGVGGVGGVHFITLVRQGLGKFHVADFDSFEPANVNRQYGAKVSDFGRHKLDVMVEEALRINPFLEIKPFPEGLSFDNMDDFLEGVDVVMDGLDFFNFEMRRQLFNRAREKGIFVITAAPLGFSSAMLVFSPIRGAMTFDEYFNIRDGMSREEKLLSFGLGVAPAGTHLKYLDFSAIDLNAGAGPSSSIACQLCSSMASMEALRILLKRGPVKAVPHYSQFDPYLRKFRRGRLMLGNRNPLQKAKMAYVKAFLLARDTPFKISVPEIPAAPAGESATVSKEVMRYILQAGIQAPSGDNAQPWKFSLADNRIALYLDSQADHSFFNFRQMASILSGGAVLENMRIAATVFGLHGEISFFPEADNPECLAHLNLKPAPMTRDPLYDAIWKRCTNRRQYAVRPLPPSLIAGLQSQMDGLKGSRLHVLTDRSDILKLARVIYRVDRIRTEHRGLHEYLQQMIHYTDEEALKARAGFPVGNLEAGKMGEIFLKFTRPWPIMDFMNSVGLGRMVPLHARMAMRASSAAVLLTVPSADAKDFLLGGAAMERLWLYLTRKGFSVQPMAALPLFWLRWRLEGREGFSQKHQALLEDVWNDWQEVFSSADFGKEYPTMLLRIGYSRNIRQRTLRKEIASFYK